jgi:hypothetical protein
MLIEGVCAWGDRLHFAEDSDAFEAVRVVGKALSPQDLIAKVRDQLVEPVIFRRIGARERNRGSRT